MGTQIINQSKNPYNPAPKCGGEERPTVTEDTMPDVIDGAGAHASEPSHREDTPTMSTGLSVTSTEQPMQKTTAYTLLEAKTYGPRQLPERAGEGELMPL